MKFQLCSSKQSLVQFKENLGIVPLGYRLPRFLTPNKVAAKMHDPHGHFLYFYWNAELIYVPGLKQGHNCLYAIRSAWSNLTRTCKFHGHEICKLIKISIIAANEHDYMKHLLGRFLFLVRKGNKTFLCVIYNPLLRPFKIWRKSYL